MANQWSKSFEMTLKLYDMLDEDIKYNFRVKPYPYSQGWDTYQRFCDALGHHKVLKEKSLQKTFLVSRVVVCSYPETTFSEAMASKLPTILMYPSDLYELNPISLPLMESLKAAKIVFTDPVSAAEHLNLIWPNPDRWWNSSATIHARDEFNRKALNLDPKWLKKWINLLKTLLLKSKL